MAIKTVGEFVQLVSKMREAQRVYARQGSFTNRSEANAFEKQVDDAIKQFEKRRDEKSNPGLGM